MIIKTTKTYRFRLVSLTRHAAASLGQLREEDVRRAAHDRRAFDAEQFVFTNDPQGQRDVAAKVVGNWSTRKRRMFGTDHVTNAWNRLHDLGWIRTSLPA